jgi:hypothetical protein
VLAVQLRDVVLSHVLPQRDGSEHPKVICMCLLEILLELLVVGFGIVWISVLDEIKVRIHKRRPEELTQLQLQVVRYRSAQKSAGSRHTL